MDVFVYRGQRIDNREWIEGYPVVCNGDINKGRVYIVEMVNNISYMGNKNKAMLGDFYEVDRATLTVFTGFVDKERN